MTADFQPALELQPKPDTALPPEWLIWADAIERREDYRTRVARGPERARYAAALARHVEANGTVDWGDETLAFVAALRSGTGSDEPRKPNRREARHDAAQGNRPG